MKKLLLILLLSLGYIGSAVAVSSLDDYYTSLCIAEKSTGFNWENNDWKITNYTPSKYVVKKVDPTKTRYNYSCVRTKDITNEIWQSYYTLTSSGQPKLLTYGCYTIKRFGQTYEAGEQDCREDWTTYPKEDEETNPKTRKLESVWCEITDFTFAPNGWFHTGYIHKNVKAIADYKDSISVSVGKCSTL